MKKISTYLQKQAHEHRDTERGFTLLELLLVVGVSALIFIGIANITQSWINTEIATSAGQYMQRVATITDKFVEGHWADGLPDTDDIMGSADPAWDDLKTALNEEGLVRGGVLRNPLGSNMRISFRTDVTDPLNPIYRASVYTITPLPNKKVSEAARQAGNYGGVVTDFTDATRAVGAFGQFDVALSQLTTAAFGCTATTREGCLIAVMAHNGTTLNGSFLYRNDVGNVLLNTMTTDLIMNNQNITGAGAVDVVDLNVSNTASLGTTTVNGDTTLNGPATMGGALTVNNGMDVSGNANFASDVQMTSGTLNVDTLNSDTLQAPTVTTNNFNTRDANIVGGALTVNDDINVNGNISATGEVFANTVNAGTINANGGEMVVGTMEVQNALEIDGAVTVTGGAIVVDRMVADHCTKIKVAVDVDHPDGYAYYGTCP